MNPIRSRRASRAGHAGKSALFEDDDPMTGVANLFDLGLVFIVGLIASLFTAYHLQDLFNERSNVTISKENAAGQMEVIVKQGKKVKALRVSPTQRAKGRGSRLGVAYRLEDGSMVYVPDPDSSEASQSPRMPEGSRP